jgi:multidrug efflux pump subunit AcrA (membrane-fusion protein)
LKWIISEGKWVTQGDLLAELELNGQEEELLLKEQAIEDLEISLANAMDLRANTVKKMDMDLDMQKLELDHAESTLAELMAGPKALELESVDLQIKRAELNLSAAEVALDKKKNLVEKGFAAESSLEPLRLRLESQRVSLKDIRRQKVMMLEPPEEEKVLEAEAEVMRWKDKVEFAKVRQQRELEKIDLTNDREKVKLRLLRFEHQELKRLLKDTEIRSPVSGLVRLARKRDWSRGGSYVPLYAGLDIKERDSIMEVLDPRRMEVFIPVHQNDFKKIVLEEEVICVIPALGDKPLKGRVQQKSQKGQDLRDLYAIGEMNKAHGQAYFGVTVEILDDEDRFKPGMGAWVHFGVRGRE